MLYKTKNNPCGHFFCLAEYCKATLDAVGSRAGIRTPILWTKTKCPAFRRPGNTHKLYLKPHFISISPL